MIYLCFYIIIRKRNTAADIKVKSTKSHVSTSLKALQNKGLIERIRAQNKKHIEIVILNKASPLSKTE